MHINAKKPFTYLCMDRDDEISIHIHTCLVIHKKKNTESLKFKISIVVISSEFCFNFPNYIKEYTQILC